MATKEERDLILDMLASGRITPDEASMLIDAIERCAEDEMLDVWQLDFADNLHTLNRSFEKSIRDVSETIHQAFAWVL